MADILGEISEGTGIISKFENAISNLSSVIDRLTRGISDNKSAFDGLTEGAKSASKATDAVNKSTEKGAEVSNLFSASFGNVTSKIFEAIRANKSLASAGVSTLLTLQMLSKGTTGAGIAMGEYSKYADEANKASAKFAETVSGAVKAGDEDGAKKAAAYKNFVSVIGEVKSFENAIMSASQTGGNFFDIYDSGLEGMVRQNENVMNKVSKRTFETANMLGIHFEDAGKLVMDIMGKLPGEFNKVYSDIQIGTKTYALTTEQVLGKVTRGIGISTAEGMKVAENMLYKFGEDMKGAGERMAVVSQASKELGMKFSDINDLASSLDSTFSMWGDQLGGMVPILEDVSKALDGTNVGIEGQIKLVQKLGDAVKDMKLPMKSFIGVMSGMRAPGGAVGVGLNIEKMLQEGKTGEIVSMIQGSMQKMTGRSAVSLDEATEDPRAQRAFMVQRQMLGKMTGIGDTGELNRLLEVMSKSQMGGTSIDAEKALSDAMGNGQDIASKQTDIMATVSENLMALDKTLIATNTLYGKYVDTVTAKGAGKDIMETDMVASAVNKRGKAAEAGLGFKEEYLEGDAVKALMESAGVDMFSSIASGFTEHAAIGGGIIKDTAENFSTVMKESTIPTLQAFGVALEPVIKSLGVFGGDVFNSIKEGIDISGQGFGTGSGMESILMEAAKVTKPVAFEPIKVTFNINMKDENSGSITSKALELITHAQNSQGDK